MLQHHMQHYAYLLPLIALLLCPPAYSQDSTKVWTGAPTSFAEIETGGGTTFTARSNLSVSTIKAYWGYDFARRWAVKYAFGYDMGVFAVDSVRTTKHASTLGLAIGFNTRINPGRSTGQIALEAGLPWITADWTGWHIDYSYRTVCESCAINFKPYIKLGIRHFIPTSKAAPLYNVAYVSAGIRLR